jgi:hypothetical protein
MNYLIIQNICWPPGTTAENSNLICKFRIINYKQENGHLTLLGEFFFAAMGV